MNSKILYIIPARGGSKGIPHKNIKELNGKPLIYYTLDVVKQLADCDNICVSTDSLEIKEKVEEYGIRVPFLRPSELATDTASTNDVLVHALEFYKNQGNHYDIVVLLQATSPFRRIQDVINAVKTYTEELDMVVSVKESSSNPYYNSYEESEDGYLHISKGDGLITRRQDAPPVWEYNGAIYVINPGSLLNKGLEHFTKIKKYVMDDIHSIDLDSIIDWNLAELILKNNLVNL